MLDQKNHKFSKLQWIKLDIKSFGSLMMLNSKLTKRKWTLSEICQKEFSVLDYRMNIFNIEIVWKKITFDSNLWKESVVMDADKRHLLDFLYLLCPPNKSTFQTVLNTKRSFHSNCKPAKENWLISKIIIKILIMHIEKLWPILNNQFWI